MISNLLCWSTVILPALMVLVQLSGTLGEGNLQMLWQLPKHTRESTMMPFKSASKNVNNLMQRSKKKGLKRKSIMNSLPLEQKSSFKIKSPNIGPSMRSLSTKEVKEPSSLMMAPNVSKGTDGSLLLILNRKRKQLILNRKWTC